MSIIEDFLKRGPENVSKYHLVTEGWKLVPIEDYREYYWQLDKKENGALLLISKNDNIKENSISKRVCNITSITKKFYETEKHTMICINEIDWGRFLIFSNDKKVE